MVDCADLLDADDSKKKEFYLAAIDLFDSFLDTSKIKAMCARAFLGIAELEENLELKQEYLEKARSAVKSDSLLEARICIEYGKLLLTKKQTLTRTSPGTRDSARPISKSYSTSTNVRTKTTRAMTTQSRSASISTPQRSTESSPRTPKSSTPRSTDRSTTSPTMFFKRAKTIALTLNDRALTKAAYQGLYECGDKQNPQGSPEFWRSKADEME